MQARVVLLGGLLVSVAFSGCRCAPPLQVLAPKIQIANPDDATDTVCAKNFVSECKHDFGTVPIGQSHTWRFAVRDPTNEDLNIDSITIEGSPNFTIEGAVPDTVHANTGTIGVNVTIKYTPSVETNDTAKVIIKSDAENIAKDADVEIDLIGAGKDLGCPTLTVSPAQCNFGAVGVGATGACQLTLNNVGSVELQVTDIGFTDDTPPGVFNASVFPIPAFIATGTGSTINFTASPTAAAAITGGVKITSTDCANATQIIPFTVQGAQTPTAVARVKSINGTPNSQQTPPVQPLDDVVLSGDQSVGAGGATIVGYAWSIVGQPSESSATLSSPNSVDTGFQFDSANGTVDGLDVAGTFIVHLQVTDSNGGISGNDATVTLNAIPTEGLHVQLSWSANVDDVDLHLAKGANPTWCGANDCYYANCKSGGFGAPNWDSAPGFTSGDPRLDIDDLQGFGPENINIVSPVNGTYTIGVHAYSGNPNPDFTPTDVEIKVFAGGALAYQGNGHLNDTDDFWTVAKVDVNGTTTVTAIDNTANGDPCF